MGVSAAVPEEQLAAAERVAAAIGIAFATVPTYEGRNATYVANNGKACLACKTELYGTLRAIMAHAHYSSSSSSTSITNQNDIAVPNNNNSSNYYYLYNGTNADDARDPTRLGLVAAAHFGVRSPLAATTKADVRVAAQHLGLPNWNVAASPCLRSRLALGVPATERHLHVIGRAERFVRQQLQQQQQQEQQVANRRHHQTTMTATGLQQEQQQLWLSESTNLRVRLLPNQQACLEIDAHAVDAALAVFEADKVLWERTFLEELQFASFTIRPFRSGSVATNKVENEPSNGSDGINHHEDEEKCATTAIIG